MKNKARIFRPKVKPKVIPFFHFVFTDKQAGWGWVCPVLSLKLQRTQLALVQNTFGSPLRNCPQERTENRSNLSQY